MGSPIPGAAVPALAPRPAAAVTPAEDERAAGQAATVAADLARIWAELLDATTPVGVHDDLFRLGAGSLAVVRFAARIAESYGVELGVDRIIAGRTVAALAAAVSAELDAADAAVAAVAAEAAEAADAAEAANAADAAEAAEDTQGAVAPDAAGLAALSDGELDELVRRLQAARGRRLAARGDDG